MHFDISIGLFHSFWLSHQKNPCYRSVMKIHQHESKIFNKMCTFEVSIGLLSLILIISSKESFIEVPWKSVNIKPNYLTNIQFRCKHRAVPCYRSVMKIHQHGAGIFSKMCSFEVSIGLYPSLWSSHQKNPCYRSL